MLQWNVSVCSQTLNICLYRSFVDSFGYLVCLCKHDNEIKPHQTPYWEEKTKLNFNSCEGLIYPSAPTYKLTRFYLPMPLVISKGNAHLKIKSMLLSIQTQKNAGLLFHYNSVVTLFNVKVSFVSDFTPLSWISFLVFHFFIGLTKAAVECWTKLNQMNNGAFIVVE